MYRQVEQPTTPPEKFEFPDSGKLSSDNRWVIMAKLILLVVTEVYRQQQWMLANNKQSIENRIVDLKAQASCL